MPASKGGLLSPGGEAVVDTALEVQRTHPASSQELGRPGWHGSLAS